MLNNNNLVESTVECFGKIPEHWREAPLRYYLKYEKGSNAALYTKEFLGDNKGVVPVYSGQTANNGILGYTNRIDYSATHGIIVSTVGAKAMSTQLISGDFCLSQNCALITPRGDYNISFAHYLLSLLFSFEKAKLANVMIPSLRFEDLDSYSLLVPPLSEQAQIAAFLDRKTAQIDTIIEKKQKLLQLLDEKKKSIINEAVTKGLNPNVPMKDSGIEWIGDIPESWQVTKIKYCSALQGRIGFKGYSKDDIVTADEGALTLGAKHINKKNELDLYSPEYLSWEKYFESPEIMVNVGDIIFTQRGSLGKVCIIEHNIGEATINPSMVILRTYPNINSKFLYNWLTADYIQNNVNLIQSNTAVPMISQFQLGNFEVLAPSLKEQEEINEFIESYKEGSNVLSKKVLIQIEKLIEYRQSLISEAVTGKIDVTNFN